MNKLPVSWLKQWLSSDDSYKTPFLYVATKWLHTSVRSIMPCLQSVPFISSQTEVFLAKIALQQSYRPTDHCPRRSQVTSFEISLPIRHSNAPAALEVSTGRYHKETENSLRLSRNQAFALTRNSSNPEILLNEKAQSTLPFRSAVA